MDLDERNASRFLTTADNLDFLTDTGLLQARQAAQAGNADEVLAFIHRVHGQISSEHREWICSARASVFPIGSFTRLSGRQFISTVSVRPGYGVAEVQARLNSA